MKGWFKCNLDELRADFNEMNKNTDDMKSELDEQRAEFNYSTKQVNATLDHNKKQ